MAAEIVAFVHGCDNDYTVRDLLQELLGVQVPLEGYLDSRTVFNIIAKNAMTVEKRLQIDAFGIRESCDRGEIRTLGRIAGN